MRALAISNGVLFLNIDRDYVLRDITYPHVGSSDHSLGDPWRFGVWVDGHFSWSDGLDKKLGYEDDSLVTRVELTDKDRLGISLVCNDAVHYRHPIYLRRIVVRNLRETASEVRLFFHHNPSLGESADCNTVIYHPDNGSLVAYKDDTYIMANAMIGKSHGFASYACGHKRVNGLKGTWVDAEDGILGGGAVSQGSVDSVGSVQFRLEPGASKTVFYWMAFGAKLQDVSALDARVREEGPDKLIASTQKYWRYWVSKQLGRLTLQDVCFVTSPASPAKPQSKTCCFGDLGDRISRLYRRSLLTVRALSSEHGAIVAAVDNDIMGSVRDTYAYMWPRDGAFSAAALDVAGYGEIPRQFYRFVAGRITEGGYLLHKYTPEGLLASSWHSMVGKQGERQLPIQEDETALPLVALWHHYRQHRCTEFIYEGQEELYTRMVVPAARFLMTYRDKNTGLPLPSYDLWEERRGVTAFTVASVYAALHAAARLSNPVDPELSKQFETAAEEIKAAFEKHMYSSELGRFVRMVELTPDGRVVQDTNIDSSMFAIFYLGLLPADDPRVVRTMEAIENRLWCKSAIGGIARYEGDYYHRISDDVQNIPGNPWIICTLWVAQWHIAKAKKLADLARARDLINWVADRANSAELLPEQVDPHTGGPVSVSPLTWSHSTVVLTVLEYLAKYEDLKAAEAKATS